MEIHGITEEPIKTAEDTRGFTFTFLKEVGNLDWVFGKYAFVEKAGTLRGMFFYRPPAAEKKKFVVIKGKVLVIS